MRGMGLAQHFVKWKTFVLTGLKIRTLLPQLPKLCNDVVSVVMNSSILVIVGQRRISLGVFLIRRCIQKFPDRVDKEINNNNSSIKQLLRSNTKGYGGRTH
jgi:hypothetical protein